MGPFSFLEVERIALRRFVVKFTVSAVRGGFLGRNVVTPGYEGAWVGSTPLPAVKAMLPLQPPFSSPPMVSPLLGVLQTPIKANRTLPGRFLGR